MTPLTALKSALGQPMLSERKAREAVIAVLESVREPGEEALHAMSRAWFAPNATGFADAHRAALDALIAEVRGDEG
jgi:hypothetical protein